MGLKALISNKFAHRAYHPNSEIPSQPLDIEATTLNKCTKSNRFATCLCKLLHYHCRSETIAEPADTPATRAPPPDQVCRFESPRAEKRLTCEYDQSSSHASLHPTVDSSLRISSTCTPPTASSSEAGAPPTQCKITTEDDYKTAIAGLREAEKLLQQRHAAFEPQSHRGTLTKIPILETFIKRKKTPSPTGSAAQTTHLPRHLVDPAYQRPNKQLDTAREACDALHRRKLLRNLAYRAVNGCDDAVAAIEKVNAHYAAKAHHQDAESISDLILNFDGTHIHASQLGSVEHTWIARFNAVRKLEAMTTRKQLGTVDYEEILANLFPNDVHDLLKPEYFAIFVTGWRREGILTVGEAKHIISHLSVSKEELEQGATWTGSSCSSKQEYHDPASLAIFNMPTNTHSFPTSTPPIHLHPHLRILTEAAVYEQKFYKGYFFANAQSKLLSFYAAQFPVGPSAPLHVLEYRRGWTFRETRLLERGALILSLLTFFASGILTDFGIIRAIRGTFVQVPGQGYWDPEDLSSFLYHRVTDSGLPVEMIPAILALHPEHDEAFAMPQRRRKLETALSECAEAFQREELQRLGEIEKSMSTFADMVRKEMGVRERVKMVWRKMCGKGKVVKPFDPFAGWR